ncbi:MAG TPA: ABC transporter permease [Streptosporangiaceae bacterium]|nr:ABC transporter permease [Streptosporangiaceae bacterium]
MTSAENDGAGQKQTAVGLAGEPPADADTAQAALSSSAPALLADSFGEYTKIWFRRVRSGESGALPVVIGLIAIIVFFQVRSSLFLSAGNLVNLITQAAWIVTLGMAEVFVLLLGEIDLSVGYTAANGAVVTLWMLSLSHPYPWWVAVLAGLAFSAAWGAAQGLLVTKLGLPSFVVTLAGLLGGAGLLLYLANLAGGTGGTIRLNDPVLSAIEGGSLSPVAGWIVMIVAVALGALFMLVRDGRRRRSNLAAPPISITILKVVLMGIAGVVVVVIGNTNRGVGFTVLRGVPWVVPVVLVVLVAWTILLSRVRFGRYVYAIGGNAEAARRAGINLSRIRVVAFTLCGLTAGMSGIIYASNLGSISNNVNGGQNVLYAVAAAVIGGTSLFGGRGRMLGAVLGGLIVAVIYNGLLLLGLGAAAQEMWTALVLLAAAIVDTLARRGNAHT